MSKPHNITIIVGLSGVGKTFTIEKILREDNQFVHFSAGTLIKKRFMVIDRDHLRRFSANQVLQNQYALVDQFNVELESVSRNYHVLFDAHMIIDTGTEIVEIPFDIFERLAPSRIVFLYDDPEVIVERRRADISRGRPERSAMEIQNQQNRSRELVLQLCSHFSIPLINFSPQDSADLKLKILG